MTIDQIRQHKLDSLDRIIDYQRISGAPYLHTDNNVYHFQCKPSDMVNWGNLIDYYRNEGANESGVEMMTQENVGLIFSVPDAILRMTEIRLYYGALFKAKWIVRDNIKAQTDIHTLNAFDVETHYTNTLNFILSNF